MSGGIRAVRPRMRSPQKTGACSYAASMNMARARMRSPQKTGACSYAEYTKNRRVPGQWTGVRA